MPHQSLQEIACCMGQPVAGNPTQYMMQKAFAAADLDWRYLTLEVSPEALRTAVRGMRAMGFAGGNFAMPHKMAVIEHLDSLTDAARRIGAVNCVFREDDRLIGENTDGKGFVQSLREVIDPAGKKIVLFGAGGTARAIGVELAADGPAEIVVVNRTEERGQQLVDLIHGKLGVDSKLAILKGDYKVEQGTDVVIHATSIGMNDSTERVPLKTRTLAPEMVVADVVFNPPETRLLRDAADRGCKTLDGLGMLVNQALIGFQRLTGTEPDAEVMREALEEFLGV